MRVRDLRSGTTHGVYGPMMRGFFRTIDPAHFDAGLFEPVPECPEDIPVLSIFLSGRSKSVSAIKKLQTQAYNRYKKEKQKQYELENKLAIERLRGRK